MRLGPLGLPEILIILVIVLLIFGPRRLPEMAKGIGQSVREFRKGIRDMKDDIETEVNKDDSPPKAKAAGVSTASAAPAPAEAASTGKEAAESKAS